MPAAGTHDTALVTIHVCDRRVRQSRLYIHLAEQHPHLKAAVDKVNVSDPTPLAVLATVRKRGKPVKARAK